MTATTDDVLASLRAAQQQPLGNLAKSTFTESASATSGLTFYDLELGAKFLYPVLTPLRNAIPPRVGPRRHPGQLARGHRHQHARAALRRLQRQPRRRAGRRHDGLFAAYKGLGVETSVDFEAQYAGQGFDDIRAIAAKTGLESLMLGEEAMILGGNASTPLGTTPTPSLADIGTGGGLAANNALSVIVVALTHDGFINASIAGGVQGAVTRTNADGTTDTFGGGAARRSANATITTANDGNATHAVRAAVAPVPGALGYAWYWGAAGAEVLGALTSVASLAINGTAAGTQTASSLGTGDNSVNALAFDGLLTQALKAGSGATITVQPQGTAGAGTPLTSDGSGGILEIDAVLKTMWDSHRLSPDTIWVSSQEALNVSRKIVSGAAATAMRFTSDDLRGGGTMVRSYLNRFSMQGGSAIDIKVHPNMPAGTMLMTTSMLPYPLAGVGNLMQIRTRQDYYQIEWPLRTRRYEYGVYADEVLQHYFPPAMGVITNIGNG